MPKRLAIIGTLFILAGISALWSIISGLLDNHVNINFAVLLLPVGIGLLRGKHHSRISAIVITYIGYLLCLILTLTFLTSQDNITFTYPGHTITGPDALPPTLAAILVAFTLLLIQHLTLKSPKVIAYCEGKRGLAIPQDRLPFPALIRRHPVATTLSLISLTSLAYFIIRPPVQSYTGPPLEFATAITNKENIEHIANQHGIDILATGHGYTQEGSNIDRKVTFTYNTTPEQLNAFLNDVKNHTSTLLHQYNTPTPILTLTSSSSHHGTLDFTITYTRGTRHGSISVTTRPTQNDQGHTTTITAQETF